MPECPKCHRDSLEYSEGRSAAWCLYSDCKFTEQVNNYGEYVDKFERLDKPLSKPLGEDSVLTPC